MAAWPENLERCPNDGWKLIADLRGQRLAGRFRIDAFLGVGGQRSSVWAAHDTRLDKPLALKLLSSIDPQEQARFERGAILAQSLVHPNIAKVYDHGRTADCAWITMELLEGETLASRIGVAGIMSARHAVLLADQILAALEHAHANEIVHRDLKPANLFLVRDSAITAIGDRVKILDFGIARLVGPTAAERFGPFFPDDDPIAPELESEVTGEHRICGTPEFMAPEQILGGEPDTRSDFYALGVILFRLVSGQLPFRARTRYEAYHRHLHEPAPSLAQRASVPIPFSLAVQRALAKNADDRYPTAGDMREALRAAVGLPPVDRPKLFPSEFDIPMAAEPTDAPAPDLDALGLHTLTTPTATHSGLPPDARTDSAPPSSSSSPPPRARASTRSRIFYGALTLGAVLAAVATYLALTFGGRDVPASASTGIADEPPPPQTETISRF